jgi:hypothetical protein
MGVFKNSVFLKMLWLIVLIGTLPAAVSSTLPPTHWCLNFSDITALFELPSVGCFGGTSIASYYLMPPFKWVYFGLFCVGMIISIINRQVIAALALAPLLLLSYIPVTELSVFPEDQISPDYFLPKDKQTSGTIHKTSLEIVPALGAREAKTQIPELVQTLALAQTSADNFWKTGKQIKQAAKNLKDAKAKDAKNDKESAKLQELLTKLKLIPIYSQLTKKQLEDAAEKIEKLKRESEKAVKTAEKKYAGLLVQQKRDFRELSSNLNHLSLKLTSTLSSGPNQNVRIWTLIISAVSLLALLLFAIKSNIRSPQFWIACLLLLMVTFDPVADAGADITLSQNIFAFFLAVYPVGLFIVTAVSLRMMALAVLQNLPILWQFSPRIILSLTGSTAWRWLPIGVCIITGLWISLYMDTRAENAVYGMECTDDGIGIFQCDGPTTNTLVVQGEDSTLEQDIYNSVDTAFEKQHQQIDALLVKFRILAKSSKTAIPDFVDSQFRAIFPGREKIVDNVPSLKPPSCRVYQISCNVTRKVKTAILDAYISTRNKQINRLNILTSDFANLSGAEAEKRIREIELYLTSALDRSKRSVRNAIADIFWTVRTLNLLANMILIIAAVKSFSYIFARVAFNKATKVALPIELLNPAEDIFHPPLPDIQSGFDPEYIFQHSKPDKYYIKPALSPSGMAQGIAWPQPHKAILRRLFSGTYKMVKVESGTDSHDTISIQASQGRQFLEWNLKAGEKVYFSQGNLAAFSESIRLSTHISLSLTAMAFGRMFYSVAEGPGILILRTFGKPEIYSSSEKIRAIDPLRYIGWSDRAKFHINSSTSLGNIYLHSAQISFAEGGAAIGDVSENGKRGAGAFRFIPAVFLPF